MTKFIQILLFSVILLGSLRMGIADINAFSVVYKIPQNDTNPPSTTISLNGILGNNGWYKSNITISLNSIDNQSGINYTIYNINNGSWVIYTALFSVFNEGNNNIYYYSVDNAGNIEQTKSQAIKIDKTAPASITNLKASSIRRTYINWTWKDPTISDTSGFSYVMVYINGIFESNVSKGVQYYNATGLMNNRQYIISTHTIDNAGNINVAWVNNTAKTLK